MSPFGASLDHSIEGNRVLYILAIPSSLIRREATREERADIFSR